MKERYLAGKKSCFFLFLLCFVMYTMVFMSKNLFSAAMASIVEAGVMTKGQTGAISAAYWIAYTPFQVVGGFAADRFSPYKLICIGLGGSVIANLVICFNQSYPIIMGAWIFNAITQFGLWPATFKILSSQIHPNYRNKTIFWIIFGSSVGLGLSMLMASLVTHWVDNFRFALAILTTTLIVWSICYPQFSKRMVEEEPQTPIPSEKHYKEHLMTPRLGKLFLASGVIFIVAIGFFRNMLDNAIKLLTPTMLMESYDSIPASIANRLSLILILFSAIGILLAGFIQKRITSNECRAMTILFGLTIPFLTVTCFVGTLPYPIVLICLAFAVLLLHGCAPFGGTYASSRFVPYGKAGTISGIINAAAGFANVFASFVFAKMAETFPWTTITLSWLMAAVVGLVLVLCVTRTWTRFINLHKSK
ncbi:MAG: MFS transporter [Clostridia bacterium]|nr:MFS transporter [Clostridia bacterium]